MEVNELKKAHIKYQEEISSRLGEFSKLGFENYLHELRFCLLTPQSKAEKCWQAVEELREMNLDPKLIENCLKTKTRFYKNKTRYILEANNNWNAIKELLKENSNPQTLRNTLAKNVKGLGLKEASHFLRNIGKSKNQLAILDRHILSQLKEMKVIKEIPQLNNKTYLELEQKMINFSNSVNIPLDELDLLFWKIESGRIFK